MHGRQLIQTLMFRGQYQPIRIRMHALLHVSIEDGSYLRLKNIMLNYTVPAQSLQSLTKGTVKGLNIYVSAQNILTFTNYSGFDPEVGTEQLVQQH
jgi:hypothetical protein